MTKKHQQNVLQTVLRCFGNVYKRYGNVVQNILEMFYRYSINVLEKCCKIVYDMIFHQMKDEMHQEIFWGMYPQDGLPGWG